MTTVLDMFTVLQLKNTIFLLDGIFATKNNYTKIDIWLSNYV